MSEKDTVLVLAAAYDDVAEAEADYEAIKALYYGVKNVARLRRRGGRSRCERQDPGGEKA